MDSLSSHATVGQLVAERPSRSRVFERLGIDYCCGGRKPLTEACTAHSLDVQAVLKELTVSDQAESAPEEDWAGATLTELADHIQHTHHAYLREALPRLSALTEKVANAHGGKNPKLSEVRDVFGAFRLEMEAHTAKEELILFPLCRQLDGTSVLPRFHCGSVANPIRVMMAEHDDAGEALANLRALTDDFTPPSWACNTYRALLSGFQELEAETHQHVHKENNILFPKAKAAEERLAGAAVTSDGK